MVAPVILVTAFSVVIRRVVVVLVVVLLPVVVTSWVAIAVVIVTSAIVFPSSVVVSGESTAVDGTFSVRVPLGEVVTGQRKGVEDLGGLRENCAGPSANE